MSSARAVSVAATKRRDTAERDVPRLRRLDGCSDGLEGGAVAAGGHLGQHALHGHPAEQLGRAEQLVGWQCHLGRAIGRAHPGTRDRHLSPAQGDQAVVTAVAHRRAPRVVAALGPGQFCHLSFENGAEHLQARPDGEGEQALFKLAGEFADGDTHRVGQHDGAFVGTALWIGLRLLGRRRPVVPARPAAVW